MNRGTMRDLLRRNLNEAVADQWTDSELNELLNLGLNAVEGRILASNPDAFLRRDRTHLVAGQHEYPWPVGRVSEIEVALLNSSTGEYDVIDGPLPYHTIRDNEDTSNVQYAHWGRYLYLAPAPSANVTNGLQVTVIPTLAMSSDSDVPDIPILYHMAAVLEAVVLAVGETPEGIERIAKALDKTYTDMGLSYRKTGGRGGFSIGVDKGY